VPQARWNRGRDAVERRAPEGGEAAEPT